MERKNLATSTSGPLRKLMGKGDIAPEARSKSSNYNKKALPFRMDDESHVAGLNAICELFANPWTTGRAYSREDLAGDIGDFFQAVQGGQIIPIARDVYDAVVAPYMAELEAKAEEEAAVEIDYTSMTKKQLIATAKSMGFTLPKKTNRTAWLKAVQAAALAAEQGDVEQEPEEETSEEAEAPEG